ncbi:delta-1-pyrroline-5-carboxylate dehydrogenase 1 [Xylariaceae sp. FL0255]|nr:delta-1-pyrroline-5-carboxylate dehydrogenase 1 [Xylariaceae sp. FL0255]
MSSSTRGGVGLARCLRTRSISSSPSAIRVAAQTSAISRQSRTLSMTHPRLSHTLSTFQVPMRPNERNNEYKKGSAQRDDLALKIIEVLNTPPKEIPVVVGSHQVFTDSPVPLENPADYHNHTLAMVSQAESNHVKIAIDQALAAKSSWESMPFADRAAIFLKAADLIANKYRTDILAATMLGQGKNMFQAEIDAAAELCDFLRFNVQYAQELYVQQPTHHSHGVWNRMEYRPLEGFVYAVSPFNFTAIGANLPCAPALMGNVVVWKPSNYATLSNWILYKVLLEAGLPPNVIQFVPGDPQMITDMVLQHKEFAALHFTGSTSVFRELYGKIAKGITEGRYRGYPRIVGETGGKNFHLIHSSADIDNAVAHTVRGAFEYSGQKCSATSRLYVPKSIWKDFKTKLVRETAALKVGKPWHPDTFIGPVIHQPSFQKLSSVFEESKDDSTIELLVGGKYDSSEGWFIHPTIYEVKHHNHELFKRELFGPVLAVYVYDDLHTVEAKKTKQLLFGTATDRFKQVCKFIDQTSEYGLTGSVFAKDREAIRIAENELRNAAGNFYINCKSTGAVVGQQAFGGARASGTNDKAGSINILTRFVSMRSIKEEFNPIKEVGYPSNEPDYVKRQWHYHPAEFKKLDEMIPAGTRLFGEM